MSSTTAPGLVTVMSVERVVTGAQPAGVPVVDGFGKLSPVGGGGGGGVGGGGDCAATATVAATAPTQPNPMMLIFISDSPRSLLRTVCPTTGGEGRWFRDGPRARRRRLLEPSLGVAGLVGEHAGDRVIRINRHPLRAPRRDDRALDVDRPVDPGVIDDPQVLDRRGDPDSGREPGA